MRRFKLSQATILSVALAVGACSVPGPQASAESVAALPRKSLALEARDYSISYLDAGDPEGQLVVFVHGTPGDAAGWADYLIEVPAGFHYVAIDRPGFGQSGPDGAVASLSEQASAVIAVIRAQGEGRAILVGHSLGGPIVAQAAVDAPEAVAGLVLLAASLDPSLEQVHWLQYVGDTWPVSAFLSRMMTNANRELMPLKGELEKLEPRLASIAAPVVIVHGTQDDLVPYANVAFMQTHLTAVTQLDVTKLEGQNHFLPWNAKNQVNAAIGRAARLTSVPGTAATGGAE
jgi:pimeloyl-ACP methyl ester carboxylesterase